jgi:uncharacterized protein YndB with AHSA1/START domain
MTRELNFVWTLEAPRSDVFRAWTDPAHLQWFYNDTQPLPEEPIEVDLRVGGAWRQRMVIDAETEYVTGGIYREIVPDERLVFTWGAVGGWPEIDPARLDDSPLVTLTFADTADATELTLHLVLPEAFVGTVSETMLGLIGQGWPATVERLCNQIAVQSDCRNSSRLPQGSRA